MRDLIIYPTKIKFDKDRLYFSNSESAFKDYLILQFLALFTGGVCGYALTISFTLAIISALIVMLCMHIYIKRAVKLRHVYVNLATKVVRTANSGSKEIDYPLVNQDKFISCNESFVPTKYGRRYYINVYFLVENPVDAIKKGSTDTNKQEIKVLVLDKKLLDTNVLTLKLLDFLVTDYQLSQNLETSFKKLRKQTDKYDQLIYGEHIGKSAGQMIIVKSKKAAKFVLPVIFYFAIDWIN
ncbi:hypothetical protein [Catenovulum agarivorans]|uniref:hypothetical protein n=1 Tax=Catenovulum agarivorans TaxID=1172192 RepID=UPI00055439AC|nr:hypothetical protein [Catenovulum agarivorans]